MDNIELLDTIGGAACEIENIAASIDTAACWLRLDILHSDHAGPEQIRAALGSNTDHLRRIAQDLRRLEQQTADTLSEK